MIEKNDGSADTLHPLTAHWLKYGITLDVRSPQQTQQIRDAARDRDPDGLSADWIMRYVLYEIHGPDFCGFSLNAGEELWPTRHILKVVKKAPTNPEKISAKKIGSFLDNAKSLITNYPWNAPFIYTATNDLIGIDFREIKDHIDSDGGRLTEPEDTAFMNERVYNKALKFYRAVAGKTPYEWDQESIKTRFAELMRFARIQLESSPDDFFDPLYKLPYDLGFNEEIFVMMIVANGNGLLETGQPLDLSGSDFNDTPGILIPERPITYFLDRLQQHIFPA